MELNKSEHKEEMKIRVDHMTKKMDFTFYLNNLLILQ